ncbi:phenylacetate-CoA oxygenase [Burkholderia sp. Bp9090]|nr:phenylacetate-CoA oxygenase [Burkholderia sp. AU28863]RQR27736.1 phenylacetate-CoA oxygenase [Burkholderia sp. Bp9131]RQR59206.1 phenylacetate-CoA oxygenase [Burkholderia sp. Bp9015]RQR68924.1 phenylacetate-CoA oxygenase [Burkholderia sp. Bp9011]RQS28244.1 phenylacetate-CoA oxygenase [Burkholderia sp. Bp8990]RQS36859.1 phenylacetate-CoA oxygenase [Burkholderia sp. Bp8989]RQS47820.1 phenylacetate-CoA oxygenase [Burkholderia sp. Bp8986]RQZ28486.1 phenylacetate-CoA oxygenase [Burkholderia sp
MWALDGSELIFGSEKRKYQESHTKVSQVYEVIHIPVSFE